MRSRNLPRWTIARRLWLGFGLLIMVLAITALVFYWQVHRIDSDVAQVVDVKEPLERAVLEMHISASDISRAVLDYARDRDPAAIEKMRDAEVAFITLTARFDELSQSDKAKGLSRELAGLYEGFKESGQETMSVVDQQYSSLLLFRQEADEVNDLIDGIFRATLEAATSDTPKKLEAALSMGRSLDRVSIAVEAYTSEPDSALLVDVLDSQADFEQAGTIYWQTSLSTYEYGWLDHIDSKFEDAMEDGFAVIAATDNLRILLGRFDQAFIEIEEHLDNELRPLMHAQVVESGEDAQAATATAATWLLVLGIIGIFIGIASALVISKKLLLPLKWLVEGAKVLSGGKLEHRFYIDAEGEFGQLARSLNQMLDNLRRSREALGESEEMAWSLLDSTSDAVILTDARGIVLSSNEVAAERYGRSLEQMIDLSIYDLIPAEVVASRKTQISEVVNAGKPIHFEDERSGVILDHRIYPVLGGKGEVSRIAIFISDITVRKWVEDVTEQLGRRNELILEAAGEGIYGLDTQGKTTFVNPAAARMLGYKAEDLIGQRHHELVHHSRPDGKSYPPDQCPIYAAFKDGIVHKSVDYEVFWRKDGTYFPVQYTSTPIIEDGKIMGAVVTFQDISERRRVEKALRQSEEKYRSIFDNAANLIISVDQEGLIVDCNSRVLQILGYKPTEIIGLGLVELFHPDNRNEAQGCLTEVQSRSSEYNMEYKMVRKDGKPTDVNVNAAAVRGSNGEYIRTICMIGQISERTRQT
ncbi:PAS domain S-box protein [Chloroflexota bacterium]